MGKGPKFDQKPADSEQEDLPLAKRTLRSSKIGQPDSGGEGSSVGTVKMARGKKGEAAAAKKKDETATTPVETPPVEGDLSVKGGTAEEKGGKQPVGAEEKGGKKPVGEEAKGEEQPVGPEEKGEEQPVGPGETGGEQLAGPVENKGVPPVDPDEKGAEPPVDPTPIVSPEWSPEPVPERVSTGEQVATEGGGTEGVETPGAIDAAQGEKDKKQPAAAAGGEQKGGGEAAPKVGTEEAGPSGLAALPEEKGETDGTDPAETGDGIGSGVFFGPKKPIPVEKVAEKKGIAEDRMEIIQRLAEKIAAGKGGEEVAELSKEELADIVHEQQALLNMNTQMEEHATYPTGPGWEDRGGLHFDIPMCMLRNGNEAEQCGIVHTDKGAGGGTKKVRITERLTTPAQVKTGEKIYESGHVKERGDVTAVVKLFGKEVLMTKEERDSLPLEDKADLAEFEKGVEKMCASDDEQERTRGEWLRDNVVGRWLFLVDGNSRLEGYKSRRKKLRDQGLAVRRHIFFSAFIVKVDANNMEDVCALSRQINDSNIEFNSKKSSAQEVYACYDINDKSQEEMDRIVTKEMLALYKAHSGNWIILRQALADQGVKYPGIVFAACLKPSIKTLLMDKSTLLLSKELVADLGNTKSQWALKRVHCANFDKRAYWEGVWGNWVMLDEPETVVPDLNVLDTLFGKHLPVSQDQIMVKLCEMSPDDFKKMTEMDRTRITLTLFVKWLAIMFAVCEAVVVQLQQFGFYKKASATRKRGDPPTLAKNYVDYVGACDPFEFGKAIVWMPTPEGPDARPFWWCASEKEYTETTVKPEVLNALRDRMTLSYFRTVKPSREKELTADRLEKLAKAKLINQVLAHFDVIPVPKLKHEPITRAGWVQPAGTAMTTLMRTYTPEKQTMYSKPDEERLKDWRTSAFKESIAGCRWDIDCYGKPRVVKVWDKGAEPASLARKALLPATPYLAASEVKTALSPPISYEAWERKRILDISPSARVCIMPVQEGSDGTAATERFPSFTAIKERLGWVTSSSSGFEPEDRPVHVVIYNAACTQEAAYDARALETPFKVATKIMSDLMRFQGTVGIIIMPGNTPVTWIPSSLQIVAQRFICLVPKKLEGGLGNFEKWGDPGTVYIALYLTPAGKDLVELPDQAKGYGSNLAHKKFKQAGTFMSSTETNIPERWPLQTINNIFEGAIPSVATDSVAVVLGEENGIATAVLLEKNMQVLSIVSRSITYWIGGGGGRVKATPTDVSFAERAKAIRARKGQAVEFYPPPEKKGKEKVKEEETKDEEEGKGKRGGKRGKAAIAAGGTEGGAEGGQKKRARKSTEKAIEAPTGEEAGEGAGKKKKERKGKVEKKTEGGEGASKKRERKGKKPEKKPEGEEGAGGKKSRKRKGAGGSGDPKPAEKEAGGERQKKKLRKVGETAAAEKTSPAESAISEDETLEEAVPGEEEALIGEEKAPSEEEASSVEESTGEKDAAREESPPADPVEALRFAKGAIVGYGSDADETGSD